MKEIVTLDIKKLVPDPLQPRQEFEPTAMNQLKKSIASKGVLNPLVVETLQNGNYLIVDGERRYRASVLVGLTEVPVLIQPESTSTERLIMRFHLQEHQKSWTHFDKARAIKVLVDSGEMPVSEVGAILGIKAGVVQSLLLLLTLSRRSQEIAETRRVPFTYLATLGKIVRTSNKLGLSKEQDKLEASIIDKIERGVIENTTSMHNLSISVEKGGADIIDNIIRIKDYTPDQALTDSKAGNLRAYQRLCSNWAWAEGAVNNGIENSVFKLLDQEGYTKAKRLIAKLEKFIRLSKFEN